MKTKQELENIKEEIEKLNAELHELTDEELEQVTGGARSDAFGDNTPLAALDNKPLTGLDDLKDAASTAIYVSGGGNLA